MLTMIYMLLSFALGFTTATLFIGYCQRNNYRDEFRN